MIRGGVLPSSETKQLWILVVPTHWPSVGTPMHGSSLVLPPMPLLVVSPFDPVEPVDVVVPVPSTSMQPPTVTSNPEHSSPRCERMIPPQAKQAGRLKRRPDLGSDSR